MSKFLLLLRGGDFAEYSEEEMQQIVQKYMAWTDKLRKEGRHVASEELKRGGRLLTNQNGRIVDGPYTETKEAIGGFFLIEADNLEEALKVSQECPHFDYGGSVELREINPH